MTEVELFNKLGFSIIRDWSDLGYTNSYSFEKIIYQNPFDSDHKIVYGYSSFPSASRPWYKSEYFYKDSKSHSFCMEEFFESLTQEQKEIAIWNMDVLT